MDKREKITPTLFDPDDYFPRKRRYTDCGKSGKPTVQNHLPHMKAARPRLQSWHHVTGSMDYSNIALVPTGTRRGSIKPLKHTPVDDPPPTQPLPTPDEHLLTELIETHGRRSIGAEIPKRILELAAPQKRSVYTKDLDLVDMKVKLSRLNVQWSEGGDRKSKSTTRVRAKSPDASPQNLSFQAQTKYGKKAARPLSDYVKGLKLPSGSKLNPGKRCVSAEKQHRITPKSQPFKGPSACKL